MKRIHHEGHEEYLAPTLRALRVLRGEFIWFMSFLFCLPINALAEGAKSEPERDFWISNRGLDVQASLHIFGAGTPLGALAARMRFSETKELINRSDDVTGWRFEFDEPLPLNRRWLDKIQDRRPLPVRLANELKGADAAWYDALNQALDYSNREYMDVEKFKTGAEKHKFVVLADLLAQPARYRGEIITGHGTLLVVRKPPPSHLVVEPIYTGYIQTRKGSPPYTIVFTELPEAIDKIPVRDWEKLNLDVTFHGYFLSLVRFPAEKGASQKDTISPYLVGRAPIVHGNATPPASDETDSESRTWIGLLVISSGRRTDLHRLHSDSKGFAAVYNRLYRVA